MKVGHGLLLLSLLSPAIIGWGDFETSRSQALQKLVELREKGLSLKYAKQYRNAESAYALGEAHLTEGDQEGAEQYFEIALDKGKLLEEFQAHEMKLRAEKVKREEAQTAASVNKAASTVDPEAAPATDKQETHSRQVKRNATDLPTPKTEATPHPAVAALEQPSAPVPDICQLMVGGEAVYRAKKHDTLKLIAAKLGLSRQILARLNGIDPKAPLHAGQVLKVDNRHIIPKRVADGLVINIPDCMLYYFRGGKLVDALPIAVGKPKARHAQAWDTPMGKFRIVAKEKDPTWRVPPSIQKEMEKSGKNLVTEVPPGPLNPLGKYAMRTSIPGILIHSTSVPSSIYGFNTHGCIRVYPEQMEKLFKEIKVNTKGEIIYQPVKVAVSEGGRVYLEAHTDVYERASNVEEEVLGPLRGRGVGDRIDWNKVRQVLTERKGTAEDVSL